MPGQRAEALGGEGGRTGVKVEEGPGRDRVGRRDAHSGRPQHQEVPHERHRDEASPAGMMTTAYSITFTLMLARSHVCTCAKNYLTYEVQGGPTGFYTGYGSIIYAVWEMSHLK